MRNSGFSLIELIVVMTIIMVITVVGLVSFSGTNQRARDGRRVSDLEKIRIALEVYRQQIGSYPVTNGNPTTALSDLVPNYIQTVPVDPKTDRRYYYDGSLYSYMLYAAMEDRVTYPTKETGGNCTLDCYYKVTNP